MQDVDAICGEVGVLRLVRVRDALKGNGFGKLPRLLNATQRDPGFLGANDVICSLMRFVRTASPTAVWEGLEGRETEIAAALGAVRLCSAPMPQPCSKTRDGQPCRFCEMRSICAEMAGTHQLKKSLDAALRRNERSRSLEQPPAAPGRGRGSKQPRAAPGRGRGSKQPRAAPV